MRAAEQSYGFWHRSFHWILFGLIAAQYVVGSVMPHIGRDTPDESWVAWHFSIGAAILFFLVLRFALRLNACRREALLHRFMRRVGAAWSLKGPCSKASNAALCKFAKRTHFGGNPLAMLLLRG